MFVQHLAYFLNTMLPAYERCTATMLASNFLAHSIKVLKFQSIIQLQFIVIRSSRYSFSSPLKESGGLSWEIPRSKAISLSYKYFFNCVCLKPTHKNGQRNVVTLMMYILLATTSLRIFIAVKVIYKQFDNSESLYLQNVLPLIFCLCFEDHTGCYSPAR